MDTKITTSNVKLKREAGAISSMQCRRWGDDLQKITNKYLGATDVARNIVAGVYSVPVSEEAGDGGRPGQQYCQELTVDAGDADKLVTASGTIDQSKLKRGRIRKVAGASYSEETKAKFIPSIPFNMSFSANKVVMGANGQRTTRTVNETFTVTQITVYHPSPIRIDSVQADAMMSLNDPSDPSAKFIVLIPLRAVNSGKPSNLFFNKIAPRLFGIKEPNPNTNEYEEITIPTGADWSLDKMFTMTGTPGSSRIKNGFFTWTGIAGYERYNAGTTVSGNVRTTTIDWRQTTAIDAPQYILLDTPVDINSEDMITLTNSLPVTPPSNAIHPIPGQTSFVFHKNSEPPAPDTLSGRSCAGIPGAVCEGFTVKGNSADASALDTIFTPGFLVAVVLSILAFIAMLIGGYFALRLIDAGYDITLRNFAEKIGRALGKWVKGVSEQVNFAKSIMKQGSNIASGNAVTGLVSAAREKATEAAGTAATRTVDTSLEEGASGLQEMLDKGSSSLGKGAGGLLRTIDEGSSSLVSRGNRVQGMLSRSRGAAPHP